MLPNRLDEVLKAAADPTRLRLLNLLRLGSICVCDLQAVLRVSQPSVSRHLAALRHAGLVRDVRKGMRIVYSLIPALTTEADALHNLLDRCCPEDALMRADTIRFREAVAAGTCRLERPDNEDSAPGAQLEGSPA
ncbi:MAG TPA: metalloregulator ArsR/SmtB family transcription factor [Acidobacteriota bacterium]|nr:metalloregulator ArsR/SmtB family transcription factor [Acidobacteriota bacterium]